METTDEITARQIKDAPFCWQHKGALTMIRDVFEDGHGHSAFALAAYQALSELASDAQSETFTARINEIARRVGASYPTTAKILNRFESLRLIQVQRNTVEGTKEHAPSTYTMLVTPLITLQKRDARRFPKGLKNQKNRNKDDDTRAHSRTRETAAAQHAKKSSSSVLSSSLEEAKKDSLWPQFENYCLSNGGAPTLKGWNTWRPKQSANGAKPRLASKGNKDLQSLRSKLIADRNSGNLSREEKDAKREQLLAIKQILKGRGIEYPASL